MKCPICRERVAPQQDNPHRPFCSPRCKAVDLGRWISGDYIIHQPLDPEDDVPDRLPSNGDEDGDDGRPKLLH